MKVEEARPHLQEKGSEVRTPVIMKPADNGVSNIRRELDPDGICMLIFDRSNSSANVFDHATLLELDSHLDWIEHSPEVRGVVLSSAKENIFVAGADLHALGGISGQRTPDIVPVSPQPAAQPRENRDAAEGPAHALTEFIQLGQAVFNRLASLRIPTVAAIQGACVGGGFEVALACERRLAASTRATKIGLPEIKLGIIPAWGGCTRLPRLIGLPRALEIILAGKTVAAERALRLGMIDEIVPRERLVAVARERILHLPKLHRPSLRVSNNPISAMLIRTRAARTVAAKTRGNYPAPFEALDVITHGISLPVEKSLQLEQAAIGRLVQTEECHNLLRLFLGIQKAKKGSARSDGNGNIQEQCHRAAVIGAGVMGAGIAQWLSSRGLAVILRDVSLDQLIRGVDTISQLYADAVRRHHFTELEARDGKDRIFAAASDVPLRDVSVVIEAATEKLALKQDIFRCLAAQTTPTTMLATNTSALSVTELAAATNAAERIVGLHFFNPVHRMELVEVVAGAKTSPEILSRAMALARQIGKVPVLVQDSPGFVVNRILMPYLVEAVRLFDSGVNAHEIDEAMLNFGMPMGPLRLLDEVGLDVAAHVVATLANHYGERVAAPPLIEKMIAAHMTGQKSGRGFYERATEKPNYDLMAMRSSHRHSHVAPLELSERMSLLMVNEAARCMEERVTASAADIDLAMVMGTGFAPFRGGPLRYADTLGAASVVAKLERLASLDTRFNPCALLKQMAETNQSFYSAKGGTK